MDKMNSLLEILANQMNEMKAGQEELKTEIMKEIKSGQEALKKDIVSVKEEFSYIIQEKMNAMEDKVVSLEDKAVSVEDTAVSIETKVLKMGESLDQKVRENIDKEVENAKKH